jgi:fermentation-respiration switch protein FrsA (DUF1100 family)
MTPVATSAPAVQKVSFPSEGAQLAGNLYYPPDYQSGQVLPAIVMGGSWTTVKEQMAGRYARRLAELGFVTLAFDYRNFGESGGDPRYYESPEMKIRDLENAVSFMETVTGVDASNIGMLSVCASAGYMVRAAAADTRVKALTTVAAWLHNPESVKAIYGGEEGVRGRIDAAWEAKKKYAQTGEVEYIPAISRTDPTAAMYGDYDYYLNPSRGAIPAWSADKFAVMSWEDWLTFNPMPTATQLQLPVLMIHSDGAVLPDNVKQFFNAIPHPQKELYWTEGGQFDFYDQEKQVGESAGKAAAFFHQYLRQKCI